jgi:hypothetical protein
MTALRITLWVVISLLVALWLTRSTIHPSLIMSLEDVLRAQRATQLPVFCMEHLKACRWS